jgi:drug/metabolite transporter (DMT)-like permease
MTLTLIPALMMLLSGSIHAVVNAMIKGGGNRMVQMALASGSSTLFVLPFLPFVDLPHGAWGWLAVAMVVHIVYFICLVRALDAGDLSSAYPVFRGTAPLLTLAASFALLGERVALSSGIGIALIAGGMFLMIQGRHLDRKTLGWSLATGALIAAYTMIDATGVRAAPNAASFIVWLFFLMGIVSMTILPLFARGQFVAAARLQWKTALTAGLLSVITFGTALFALSMGPTAPLAALRETGMVTALLISIFVLKEPVSVGRGVAILVICSGAVLILAGAS